MKTPALTEQALNAIASHPLTGNVRELENLLHRAVALSDGDELHVECATSAADAFGARPSSTQPVATTAPVADAAPGMAATSGLTPCTSLPNDLQAWLDQQEREILVRALREANFNRTATAARLGISLRQIRYRIARLNISAPSDNDAHDDLG